MFDKEWVMGNKRVPSMLVGLIADSHWSPGHTELLRHRLQELGIALSLGEQTPQTGEFVLGLLTSDAKVGLNLRNLLRVGAAVVIVPAGLGPYQHSSVMVLSWDSRRIRHFLEERAHPYQRMPENCESSEEAQEVPLELALDRLTKTERRIYEVLLAHGGTWLNSRDLIVEAIGTQHRDTTIARVHVHRLRQKLRNTRLTIHSDRRLGYRLGHLFE